MLENQRLAGVKQRHPCIDGNMLFSATNTLYWFFHRVSREATVAIYTTVPYADTAGG